MSSPCAQDTALRVWPLRWQNQFTSIHDIYPFLSLEQIVLNLKGSFEHLNSNQIKSNLYRVLPSTSSIPESVRRFYLIPKVIQDHDCGKYQLLQLSYFISRRKWNSLQPTTTTTKITPNYPLAKMKIKDSLPLLNF